MIITDRIAAMLSGRSIPAKTKNEAAVKSAIKNSVPFDLTIDPSTGEMSAETTADFETIFKKVKNFNTPVFAEVTVQNGIIFEAPLTAKNFGEGAEWLAFGVIAMLDHDNPPTFYALIWSESGALMRKKELGTV